MTDDLAPTFADPLDYDLERQKLARRRKIAEELIATESEPRMMGNWVLNTGPMGGVAAAIGRGIGTYDQQKIDEQSKLLSDREVLARNRITAELGRTPTKEVLKQGQGALLEPETEQVPLSMAEDRQRRFGLYGQGMGVPSLRKTLEAQLGAELKAPLQEELLDSKLAGAQAVSDARNKAMLDGINARIQGAIDLKKQPSTHITITNPGGGADNPFAGPMTQIGVVPEGKEGAGEPIYRHTKSGRLFQFDPSGQPKAYTAIAISPTPEGGTAGPSTAPKPVPMDAATRKAVHEANLGMDGIKDAKAKINLPDAAGAIGPLNAVPGAEVGRQYTGNKAQIAARAAVSNIGSLKLHDRSGAAVTISEFPRLAPFIPKVTDNLEAANAKLDNLFDEYARMQKEWSGKPATATRRKWNAAKGDFE